jgi:N-acetylglutamate synthase-like GNAT family acetyltransferase
MSFVRLALENDEDACIALTRQHHEENLPHRPFDEERSRATFRRSVETGHPTIFVAEQDKAIIGLLMAVIYDFASSGGHFTTQEVVFVTPDKRGSRASAQLIDTYNQWAEKSGAAEIYTKLAINPKLDRNMRFFKRFGFCPVGVTLMRLVGAK